jgi:hypothetical protein
VGCAKQPQTGQPGGPAPAIVDIWHSLQGTAADALQAQVQSIMKAHPEVIVQLKYVPEQNFAAFSYQAEVGGEGPEIFIARKEIIRQLYDQGVLAKTVDTDQGSFPAALANFRFGGVGYALPWLTDVPLLYFRTDTAAAPTSLADLFSSKGGVSLLSADTATLASWWSGQGGRLMSGGKPILDDPGNVSFLQQLRSWQNDRVLRIDPEALTSFAKGETPFVIAGASQAGLLTQANVPWGSMPLTDLVNGQGTALLGMTLGIANSEVKTTEPMKPAIQIVEKALLTPEVEGAISKAVRLVPANMNYYQSKEAQKGVFPQAQTALSKTWVLDGNASEWKLISLQDTAWNNALAGNLTPEDALTNAQQQAIKVISVKGKQ